MTCERSQSKVEDYGLEEIPLRQFEFEVVKDFIDPENLYVDGCKKNDNNRKQKLIKLDNRFLKPSPKFGGAIDEAKLQNIIDEQESESQCLCRLVYFSRHGEACHNRVENTVDKTLVWALGSFDPRDLDPALTKGTCQRARSGETEAREIGMMIHESPLPNPQAVISSDLCRSQQTAVIASQIYGEDLVIRCHPELREFQGPYQFHVSDGRHSLTYTKGSFDSTFPGIKEKRNLIEFHYNEEDTEFKKHETYINVDIRIEKALNDIFSNRDMPNVVHVVTHGRVLDSVMRVLGYDFDKETQRSLEYDNGATTAMLIVRKKRAVHLQREQQAKDRKTQKKELEHNEEDYLGKINMGFDRINNGELSKVEKAYVMRQEERLEELAKLEELDGFQEGTQGAILRQVAKNRLHFLRMAKQGEFRNIEKLSDLMYIATTQSARP